MKRSSSRSEAKKKIDNFFEREEFNSIEVKKIKRLAMKYKIRLGDYRKRFCKTCYSNLKGSKRRVTKTHLILTCLKCGENNKFRMKN